jgi:hypothetical protein
MTEEIEKIILDTATNWVCPYAKDDSRTEWERKQIRYLCAFARQILLNVSENTK